MEKKDFLPFCRYYKGEKECPKDIKISFWEYERAWIDLSVDKDEMLGNMLDEYIAAGLSEFEMQDDTPIILKAYLFNRFCQYSERIDIDAFKKFYLNEYKKEA